MLHSGFNNPVVCWHGSGWPHQNALRIHIVGRYESDTGSMSPMRVQLFGYRRHVERSAYTGVTCRILHVDSVDRLLAHTPPSCHPSPGCCKALLHVGRVRCS